MTLEQLLPDSTISEFQRLGNTDTDTSFKIADLMIVTYNDLTRNQKYPKMQYYKGVAELLGGKSSRMAAEYMAVGEVFPPSKRDGDLGFNIHSR